MILAQVYRRCTPSVSPQNIFPEDNTATPIALAPIAIDGPVTPGDSIRS
jgi:hypothetical protein